MIRDCIHDGYNFGVDGKLVGHNIVIVIRGNVYYVFNNIAYDAVTLTGVVTESDDDTDVENNEPIANVACKLDFLGLEFNCTTDEYGRFVFENVPCFNITLSFTADGYIDASMYMSEVEEDDIVIVMDREVSNTLKGRVTIADTDMNHANNEALEGATVTLIINTSTNIFEKTTTTDSNGYYIFESLTAGVYSLTISCEGYITVNQTVYVKYNETTINNVIIEAISDADDEEGRASGKVTNAVIWAKENGIVNGVTAEQFAPNANITREQIASIIHRYAKYKGYDVSVGENTNILSYDDADSVSEYAVASMQYAVGSGIIKGKTVNAINPRDNATRAEIAVVLQRFIGNLK